MGPDRRFDSRENPYHLKDEFVPSRKINLLVLASILGAGLLSVASLLSSSADRAAGVTQLLTPTTIPAHIPAYVRQAVATAVDPITTPMLLELQQEVSTNVDQKAVNKLATSVQATIQAHRALQKRPRNFPE